MKRIISREQCALLFLSILIPGALAGVFISIQGTKGVAASYLSYYFAVLAAVVFGLGVLRDEERPAQMRNSLSGRLLSCLANAHDRTLFAASGIFLHAGIATSIYSGGCSRPATTIYMLISGISLAILVVAHLAEKTERANGWKHLISIIIIIVSIMMLSAYAMMAYFPLSEKFFHIPTYATWACQPQA